MDAAAITRFITETLPSVEAVDAEGYTFFFYGTDRKQYFATLATKDNDYDRESNLDRGGLCRLNIGVGKETYRALLGPQPKPGVAVAGHDFTAVDRLMPHPTYASGSWVCVVNPGAATWEKVKALLAEAHALVAQRHARRSTPGDEG